MESWPEKERKTEGLRRRGLGALLAPDATDVEVRVEDAEVLNLLQLGGLEGVRRIDRHAPVGVEPDVEVTEGPSQDFVDQAPKFIRDDQGVLAFFEGDDQEVHRIALLLKEGDASDLPPELLLDVADDVPQADGLPSLGLEAEDRGPGIGLRLSGGICPTGSESITTEFYGLGGVSADDLGLPGVASRCGLDAGGDELGSNARIDTGLHENFDDLLGISRHGAPLWCKTDPDWARTALRTQNHGFSPSFRSKTMGLHLL